MTFLTNLKVAAATRSTDKDVVGTKRSKFAAQVQQQLDMLKAEKNGTHYVATKQVLLKDENTGATVHKEVTKRLKQWHFMQNGKLYLQFYYGNKVIALGKKGNAVECANADALIGALETVNTAVLAGELDAQIEAVSTQIRGGFER